MITVFRLASCLPAFISMACTLALMGCAPQLDRDQSDRVVGATDFDSAEVTLWVGIGVEPREPLTRDLDQRSANDLAAYFPGVGTNRRSNWADGRMNRVEIVFHRNNGSVEVDVSGDYQCWSEGNGHGDFEVRGNLREYLGRLFNVPNEHASD